MNAPAEKSPATFAGQVAFITGTSDQGIGGAVAERLASAGAAVMLVAPDEPRRLIKRLRRRDRRFLWASCDITQPDQVRRAVQDCHSQLGPIDVLVNNAGVELAGPLDAFTDQECHSLLEVNLAGTIRVTRAALPCLNEPGVIINVSSALALGGCPGFSIYSASKAGMDGFTQSLAWELAPRRIRVISVAPGLVFSAMINKHVEHWNKEIVQRIEACHPLGIGMPQDVADVIGFLASQDARWITGITIPVGWAYGYPLPVSQFMESRESRVESPEPEG